MKILPANISREEKNNDILFKNKKKLQKYIIFHEKSYF